MNKTKVTQLRKERGLTQQALADKANVTIRTIQRLEAGEDVSLNSLSTIASALSVPISGLFDDIEQKEKEEEILTYSQEQAAQLTRRKNESKILKLILLAFNILFLSLYAYWIGQQPGSKQPLLVIILVFLFFIMLAGSIYIVGILGVERLDKKYPKTVGLIKHHQQPKKIDNVWDFWANYWWIIFPIGGFLSWFIPAISHTFE